MSDQSQLIPVKPEERIAAQENALQILDNDPGQGNVGGRGNTNIDENCVQLLIAAFQRGLTVRNACIYVGISKTAYYDRCKKDASFLDTMERAQNYLAVQAGSAIVDIVNDVAHRDRGKMARWIAEKKMPEEYGQKIAPTGPTQNNFYLLTNEQISNIGQQPDISQSNPTELLKTLEAASDLDDE